MNEKEEMRWEFKIEGRTRRDRGRHRSGEYHAFVIHTTTTRTLSSTIITMLDRPPPTAKSHMPSRVGVLHLNSFYTNVLPETLTLRLPTRRCLASISTSPSKIDFFNSLC